MDLDKKICAILASDIVGFSSMMELDEDGTIRKIKELFSKNDEPLPQLVLLADREVDIFQGKRAGANDVIVKPLTASKIKKILTK